MFDAMNKVFVVTNTSDLRLDNTTSAAESGRAYLDL